MSTETGGPSGQERRELRYMHASHANISNFVSVKLSGKSNYRIWKTQMLCFIRSQGLEDILQQESPNNHFNELVKGWIFGSVNEDILQGVIEYEYASVIWAKLVYYGHDLMLLPDVSQGMEDSRYMHASKVNVSNFLSVKLSGRSNYHIWKAQMLCLLQSMDLEDILQQESPNYYFNELVKGWIFGSLSEDILVRVIDCKYASKVWKRLENLFGQNKVWGRLEEVDSDNDEDARSKISDVIKGEIESSIGDKLCKDLKKAVVEGCWWKAKAILKNNKDAVRKQITENGDTILHLAVALGQNKFLEKLLNFIDVEEFLMTENSKEQTAFLLAVLFDNYYAFQLFLRKKNNLLDRVDYTLERAIRSHLNLNLILHYLKIYFNNVNKDPEFYDDGFHQYLVSCLEKAIFTKRYDLALELVNIFPESVTKDDHVLMTMATTFPSELGIGEAFLYPSLNNKGRKIVQRSNLLFDSLGFLYTKCEDVLWRMRSFKNNIYILWLPEFVLILLLPIALLYPIYQLIFLLVLVLSFPFSMFYFLMWKVLAIFAVPIKNIEIKKKEYKEAKELLNTISKHISEMSTYPVGHPGYSRPLLEAARQDAFEVVDEILFRTPGFIKSVTKEEHNIIHLAIINRSEKIYNLIYHMLFPMGLYRNFKDSSGNNLLHLTGRLAPPNVLACTTGAALQLQKELQWYEEVKKLMLPRDLMEKNENAETPQMVFTREHKDLMKEGEQWMKTTAESCSITAALIVTIVFAAAITVPGGSNQETGIPLFRKDIAFNIFAVSDAISLFSSATSLLIFLSILTTRFSEADFLISLPRRLIIGLCALFLSTTSMIVAFGAILFVVFCDQRPWMLAPIGILACFPIATIFTLQFPLLFDLFRSTYIPIFGKQSYIERGRFIPTNPMIEFS